MARILVLLKSAPIDVNFLEGESLAASAVVYSSLRLAGRDEFFSISRYSSFSL